MEKSAEDWYNTTRLTTTSTSWEYWRNSFLDSFGQKGWSSARSAFSYRYISGSLSDYVQTKMNLLVSFNPKMDNFTLMAQIVCGLPVHLQERVDIADTPTVGKLISKINSFNPPPLVTSLIRRNRLRRLFHPLNALLVHIVKRKVLNAFISRKIASPRLEIINKNLILT